MAEGNSGDGPYEDIFQYVGGFEAYQKAMRESLTGKIGSVTVGELCSANQYLGWCDPSGYEGRPPFDLLDIFFGEKVYFSKRAYKKFQSMCDATDVMTNPNYEIPDGHRKFFESEGTGGEASISISAETGIRLKMAEPIDDKLVALIKDGKKVIAEHSLYEQAGYFDSFK